MSSYYTCEADRLKEMSLLFAIAAERCHAAAEAIRALDDSTSQADASTKSTTPTREGAKVTLPRPPHPLTGLILEVDEEATYALPDRTALAPGGSLFRVIADDEKVIVINFDGGRYFLHTAAVVDDIEAGVLHALTPPPDKEDKE